tara:strand:- start:769 stop:1533 length:765 start_codon:yes stop_codon:yes gene_type:complete
MTSKEVRKVAIITGAGSGIGRSCAHALLAAGYNVVLAGRTEKKLLETQLSSGELRNFTLPVVTDVTKPKSVRNLFDQVIKTYGQLDLLFNNAGVSAPNILFENLSIEQWQSVINVNLTGTFLCAQEAIKVMKNQKPQGGRIINNGSISADRPRPHSAPYTSSKHAITGLTKSISLDSRKYNIACGQIDIGNASTDMTKEQTKGVPQANGTNLVEPTFNVKNVADAVVYMAGLPLDANVQFMTIMATNMPFIGRG